jgi:hypothetical protein
MTEPANRLRQTIAELEAELRDVKQLDPETRAMLESALLELQTALHAKPAEDKSTEPKSLADRLSLAAGEFEGSHPTLASLLHRMVDALTQLGI